MIYVSDKSYDAMIAAMKLMSPKENPRQKRLVKPKKKAPRRTARKSRTPAKKRPRR